MPLDRTETAIFAWMLKKLGGNISIPRDELLNLEGWLVEFEHNHERFTFDAKLTRVGETIEGEVDRRDDPAATSGAWLRPSQRLLPVRRSLLASEPESEGDSEVSASVRRAIQILRGEEG